MGDLDGDLDGVDPRFVAQLEESLDDIRAGRVDDARAVGRRIELRIEAHKRAAREREELERAGVPQGPDRPSGV